MFLIGCGAAGRGGYPPGPGGGEPDMSTGNPNPNPNGDMSMPGGNMGGQAGCGELSGCYTVYGHSDHVLYHIDLPNKMLIEVGPFNAPMVNGSEDTITDLAVAPDANNTIYVISKTTLYTADPKDGHVTTVGPVTACGTYAVALTFMPDGTLYAADYKGAFCKIDISTNPPKVTLVGQIGNGMAIAGDLVAVTDSATGQGVMYGTAYNLSDASNTGSQIDNILVRIDPSTGHIVQTVGMTGFPKLFGVAFAQGQVFGFVHSDSMNHNTGQVVTIDPRTGAGASYNSFNDPTTNKPIGFAGAGVNSQVMAPPIM
jgi:hypothetical protein